MQPQRTIRTLLTLLPALAAAQPPVFHSDTRVVEVAIIAQDLHHIPIQDLRKEDLRLFDNGIEQTILSYDKIGTPPLSGNQPGSPSSSSMGSTPAGRIRSTAAQPWRKCSKHSPKASTA